MKASVKAGEPNRRGGRHDPQQALQAGPRTGRLSEEGVATSKPNTLLTALRRSTWMQISTASRRPPGRSARSRSPSAMKPARWSWPISRSRRRPGGASRPLAARGLGHGG